MTKGFYGAARSGFSLVELSIVLVILGLLTGGILTGQNLIRAAELRSVTTKVEVYRTAVYTFRDKYLGLPGDLRNAEDFWGSPDGNPANCPDTAGTGTETCNGNGDGLIDIPGGASEYGERFTFWQHLANAGMIEGTYTGRSGSGDAVQADVNVNVPASRIGNAGFASRYIGTVNPSGGTGDNYYAGPYGNIFFLGTKSAPDSYHYRAAIAPEEAWSIDKKIDDGRPAYGNILTWRTGGTYTPDCATDADETVAEYNVALSSIECALIIRTGY